MPATLGAGTGTTAAVRPVIATTSFSAALPPSLAVPRSISWPPPMAPVAPVPAGAVPTICMSRPYATWGRMKLVVHAVSTQKSSSTPLTPRSCCFFVARSGRPRVMAA